MPIRTSTWAISAARRRGNSTSTARDSLSRTYSSHPNGVLRPSDTDLGTFQKGAVHIIIGAPYERNSWQAFDRKGNPQRLDVLDVELPEAESFFDFTQADIDEELKDK
jgi:proteasome lid subunit RPN8/RPN11